ncbi:unnamed protein product [Protopolystoma xenopodis]|uniref:Uncharacterized protein n=1 Tax=Protopolystoma xenopodis TaxID=117903 RepID=A0A3S5A882_9PLAT|nr:unnamed protein product [Protopolystoma xenopodis]
MLTVSAGDYLSSSFDMLKRDSQMAGAQIDVDEHNSGVGEPQSFVHNGTTISSPHDIHQAETEKITEEADNRLEYLLGLHYRVREAHSQGSVFGPRIAKLIDILQRLSAARRRRLTADLADVALASPSIFFKPIQVQKQLVSEGNNAWPLSDMTMRRLKKSPNFNTLSTSIKSFEPSEDNCEFFALSRLHYIH